MSSEIFNPVPETEGLRQAVKISRQFDRFVIYDMRVLLSGTWAERGKRFRA
jgi:hypothetical protein